jgi:hypothetical protein
VAQVSLPSRRFISFIPTKSVALIGHQLLHVVDSTLLPWVQGIFPYEFLQSGRTLQSA